MSEALERITVDEGVMMGKPCVRGTRVTVETVLDALRDWGKAKVCDEYEITPEDVDAALEYAYQAVNTQWRLATDQRAAARSS